MIPPKPRCYERPLRKRLPRRSPVTLCIAVACEDKKGKERVVIGNDWMISGAISAGADIQDKLYWINDDIALLVSGVVTRAVELRDSYRTALHDMKSKKEKLNYLTIRKFIKAGPRLLKKDIADEVVTFATGLSYVEFRAAIKRGEIPQSVSTGVFKGIESKDLECEVIIVAFVDDNQYIFQVERSGHVEECENFALVGEGTYVAEAILYLRKHDSRDSVEQALYHVWEALHLAARRVPTVSKTYSIDVLYPPKRRGTHVTADELTDTGFKFMKEQFGRFGIKRIKSFPELPKGSLEREEF